MGDEKAWENKVPICLASAAMAETIADAFLCPLEAVRIRAVSDPEFCDGLADGFSKMLKAEGVGGFYEACLFYAGLAHILANQVPYTMTKFDVQGKAADAIYASMGKTPSDCGNGTNISVSAGSGVISGVDATIISHPADTLLSKVIRLEQEERDPCLSVVPILPRRLVSSTFVPLDSFPVA